MVQPVNGFPSVRQAFAEDVEELKKLSQSVSDSPEASLRLEDGHFKTGEVGKWRGRALSMAAFFMPFLRSYVDETLNSYSQETAAQQEAAVRHLNNMVQSSDNKPTALTERTVNVARAMQFIKENPSNRSTAPKNSWVIPPTVANGWRSNPKDRPEPEKLRDNLELEYRVFTTEAEVQQSLQKAWQFSEQQQTKMAEDFATIEEKVSKGEEIRDFEKGRFKRFKEMSDSRMNDQTAVDTSLRDTKGSIALESWQYSDFYEEDPEKVRKVVDRSSDFHTETETGSGVAHCTGRRESMDDAVLCTRFMVQTQTSEVEIKLTGVFDGHGNGGDIASDFARNNLINHLKNRLEDGNPESLTDLQIFNALKLAFVDTGNSFIPPEGKAECGTTANVVLQVGDNLWTANVGDSRAVLLDPEGRVMQLSEDAKPTDDHYKKAIEKRGGYVDERGKVNGRARVAGDLGGHFAYGAMSARPRITKVKLPPEGREGYKLVQGCDGLFDVANSDVVGGFVHQSVARQASNAGVAGQLAELAYKADSQDNVSVIVTSL